MVISKLSLPRRTFLRGVGATLALPFLDAMVPALTALSKTAANPVRRLGFIYAGNGIIHDMWVPKTIGAGFELTPSLSPLAPFQKQVVVVTGLAHLQANSFGDGNGDHPRAAAAWLTGVHAYDKGVGVGSFMVRGDQVQLATSVDQIAAKALGKDTPLPSLELALENPTQIACDTTDCFFNETISWRSPTTPNPMEAQPRVVFERLFGDESTPAQRLAQMRQTGSILDSVTEEVARLGHTLGSSDRTKLDEYLEAVREIEQRIQGAEERGAQNDLALPERPVDIPESFEEHARLMFDLQTLAFQADITRVFTLMLAREQSGRTYPHIGVPDQHHGVSHHRSDAELIAKKVKIDTFHVQLFASFLEKLRSTPDGDGSLLDHALILYGGGLGDPNLHLHTNLPTLLAGGSAGQLKGGRHLVYPENTPMTNLLLTMLDKVGVPTPEKIGDSTEHLSGV